jgi:glycosyltransferase involved in cell wall biosynthesis
MAKSLYICYFGMREPLVQTQVLPYLRELIKANYADTSHGQVGREQLQVTLLTFEPDPSIDADGIRARLCEEGIEWHWLRYHKRFSVLATAWDILRGTLFTRKFIRDQRPDILHGRVHVPTLMGALARKLSRHKPKLLFDIRGFFPEEYTDAGVWPEGGWLYRSAKRVERWLLKESDGFVVLTEKARAILFPESAKSGIDVLGRPVEVIPCCVDLNRFAKADDETRIRMRAQLGVEERRVIVYVGSFGGWYMTEEMLDFFESARALDANSFAMILTQRDQDKIAANLEARGFTEKDFYLGSTTPAELSQFLAAADVSLSFIKACYSKQSSSPTKIAEYLACGLPIVTNAGVGDVDTLIEHNEVGTIIDDFSSDSYKKALIRVAALGDISAKCRESARKEFDLEKIGGERYRRLYDRLLSEHNLGNEQ